MRDSENHECSARRKSQSAGQSVLYLILVAYLLCFYSGSCHALKFGAKIKKAEISLQDNYYVLSAEMTYQLSKPADKALRNGVPLFWNLHIKVQQQRDYLWDKTLVETNIRYRIQYHALLNMYRVRNESTGSVNNFSTLSAALDLISVLHNVRIMNKNALDPKHIYLAGMKIIFDREALPLPLRPIAYLNSQWYLSSDWYLWSLTK